MTKFTKNKFPGSNIKCVDVNFDIIGSKGEIYESKLVVVLNSKGKLGHFVDFNVRSHNPNSGQKWPVSKFIKKKKNKLNTAKSQPPAASGHRDSDKPEEEAS